MGLHRSFYSRGQQQGRCSAGWTGPESDRQLQSHYVSVSSSAGAALERGANLGLSHVTTGRDYVATPVGGERRQRSTNMQLIRGRPGRTLGRRPHSVPLSFGLAAVGGGPLDGAVTTAPVESCHYRTQRGEGRDQHRIGQAGESPNHPRRRVDIVNLSYCGLGEERGGDSTQSFPTIRMVKGPWRYDNLQSDCAVSRRSRRPRN